MNGALDAKVAAPDRVVAHAEPQPAPESPPQAEASPLAALLQDYQSALEPVPPPGNGHGIRGAGREARTLRRILTSSRSSALRDDVDARRRCVLDLWVVGFTGDEIAQALGVSPATVDRDLQALRAISRASLDPERADEVVCQRLEAYTVAVRQALLDYYDAETPEDRARALLVVLRAQRQLDALLLAIGVLPRTPPRLKPSPEEEAVAGLSREERQAVLRALVDLGREADAGGEAAVPGQPDVGPAFPECHDELVGVRDGRA